MYRTSLNHAVCSPNGFLRSCGATPLEAMKAAGHGSGDMTLLYTVGDAARERSQVQAMFDKLMEMPEGKPQ